MHIVYLAYSSIVGTEARLYLVSSRDAKGRAIAAPIASNDAQPNFKAPCNANLLDPLAIQFHACAVTALAVSRDTEWIASGSKDGVIVIRKATDPTNCAKWHTGSSAIHALVFSPYNEWLASVHESGRVNVWSIKCDGLLCGVMEFRGFWGSFKSSSQRIRAVAWSPDEMRIAAISDNASVYICDWPPSSKEFRLVEHLNNAPIPSIIFSPNSQLLAYGVTGGRCRIWNLADNRLQAELSGGSTREAIRPMEFDMHSSSVLVCFGDGTARVWNIDCIGRPRLLAAVAEWCVQVRHASLLPGDWILVVALVDGVMSIGKRHGPPTYHWDPWLAFNDPDCRRVKSVHLSSGGKVCRACVGKRHCLCLEDGQRMQ